MRVLSFAYMSVEKGVERIAHVKKGHACARGDAFGEKAIFEEEQIR